MTASVRWNPVGFADLIANDLAPWLQRGLEIGKGVAVREVNVDVSTLQSTITTRIDIRPDGLDGYILAGTNYAIWQELEPDDQDRYLPVQTTTGIVRKRRGGKAFLRPGALAAIRSMT